jgi:type II secretory pathway pseudopilin PulG
MSRQHLRENGVSLVEALVALAVMAFGMLAVVGVQATLRLNADVAKQRSEAVRIAQEAIEDWRSFVVLGADPDDGQTGYEELLSDGEAEPLTRTNAVYSLRRTVSEETDPRRKRLTVEVGWTDRAGQAQSVQFTTVVAGITPNLAASLSLPAFGSPIQVPGGRHGAIPTEATPLQNGSSSFRPPQAEGGSVRWIFDDTTGFITSICTTVDPSSCIATNARLLRGFVRFATGSTQPTPAQAEVPPGPALPVQVSVSRTLPTPATSIACYQAPIADYVVYYCAIPVTSTEPRWSGRSLVGGLSLADSLSDAQVDRYRVCRYTPVSGCHPNVLSTIWGTPGATASCTGAAPTPSRLMTNSDHPLDYAGANAALTNQNFLVIRAGNGSTAFDCPADDASTPLVNGNTWRHQPAS